MKRNNNNNSGSNPNAGWNQREQWYLNRYDNTASNPDVQILTDEYWEDKNKEVEHKRWCILERI
jgi:hypothetical protein